ncbi:Rv3654c family TadE-like protein [Streptomyces sp. NPDC006703]|uniref:Rv3654c family TadE-like protein n=1 Tax=Streptomyces sp. NPDC006703 TaxID=3364759 RepID=UPI0036B76595
MGPVVRLGRGLLGRWVRGARGGDRGSATVWVALTVATMCAVFAAVLGLGQVVAARHRAGGAADLAALAAADRALWGSPDACAKAAEVARAQGAELVRCSVAGEIADVRVRARFGPYGPTVRSRAGPARALPGLPAAVP